MRIQLSTFNVNSNSLGLIKPKDISDWLIPSNNHTSLPEFLVVGTQESIPLQYACMFKLSN